MAFFKSGNAIAIRPSTTVSLLDSGDRVKVADRIAKVVAVSAGLVTLVFEGDEAQQTFPVTSVQKIG
jgi:hypothetical protein